MTHFSPPPPDSTGRPLASLGDDQDTRERNQSLWLLTAGPLIWSLHFLASYLTAALWCAKVAGPGGSLHGARLAIAGYTLLALAGIAVVGWIGLQRHRLDSSQGTHEYDTPGDRHRFLGFATLLLSGLSFVATIFVALAAVFVNRCD